MDNTNSKTLLPALIQKKELVQSKRRISHSTEFFGTHREGTPHINVQRHITGLRKFYSKKQMEKQMRLLLSVNHTRTLPRGSKIQFNS